MFRKKVIIIVYEIQLEQKVVRGTYYAGSRLFSYGTLFDVAFKSLAEKHGYDNISITNVIKL